MEFIRGTTLVHLKMRCWGGEKKASRDSDIKLGADGKLPPEKLLDLGRKKIFPPKALDPLMNKRKAAERACLAEGTRFMGGFAVPDEVVEGLVAKLDDIKEKFYAELQVFLADFDRNKEAWIAENDEFAHIIRDQVPDREAVAKTFEFSIKLYKLQPIEGYEPDEEEVANQILHEVGLTCKQMSDRMLDRKRAISGKHLSEQLDPLVKKLDTLSFGNGRILTVLNEFMALQKAIPMEMIDQDHSMFGQVLTFLSMCADSNKLERIIKGDFSVNKLIESMKRSVVASVSGSASTIPKSTQPAAVTTHTISSGAYF
ncbi:MAG: DUF3150 domain-containing protein [Pseudomonadales bacterium]|nr:DUF3150 domain-containing protein [Pseudomonadales bacterium]